MAASTKIGKLIFVLSVSFFVSALLGFSSPSLVRASKPSASPNSNTAIGTDSENGEEFNERVTECDSKNPNFALLSEQQRQLEKLEELVLNLKQLVATLQPQFTEKVNKLPLSSSSSHDEIKDVDKVRDGGAEPVLLTKFNTFWSDRFQFVSAVKLSSNPTCVNVLPFRDFEGLNKYFAVGDDKGRLYVFLRSGDIAVEFDLFVDGEESSPVISMVSYLSIFKNESTIITGHKNGAVIMLRVWEVVLSGEEWSSLHIERVGRFDNTESGKSRINTLDVHYVGVKRYVLAINDGGDIIVFKEDGAIHGVVTPSRRPIAFLKQRLLFLTETGAGSLDLRSMRLKESECEGLNSSFALNYVFDAMERTKAYGFTSDGDFIHTVLLGDIMNFKCRVRSKKKLDLDEPVALQAIKGYLLIANREKVFVYNISSHHYVRVGGIRLLFSVNLNDIISTFLNQALANSEKRTTPLIASDYEKKHVIVSLGNGYVAMYRSNLPVFKSEFNSILWTSPVLFFILFLFVVWNFYSKKKAALTLWDHDDPFNSPSVTSAAPLVSSTSNDRPFADSSRNSEIMDLRGSSRYGSPTRFAGGTATSVDPRYRPNSELMYRGANPEATGVTKRRDMLFVNSVDDSS